MERAWGYCERLGPGLLAEPLNAATNAAFILAGAWAARRWGKDPLALLLAVLLLAVGVGSLLFHTLATAWAAAADTLPILLFVLVYAFAAHRRFWRHGVAASVLGALAAIPWTLTLAPLATRLPVLGASAAYWPIAAFIALHAALLARREPVVARGLAGAAALLALSILLRSLDRPLCAALPVGTHWAWHLLNAVVLAWTIEVLGRHGRAGGAGRGLATPAPSR